MWETRTPTNSTIGRKVLYRQHLCQLSSLTPHQDITLALAHGIDGFALNIGSDGWQAARVADAYEAARGTRFQLFISFDMACVPFRFRSAVTPPLTLFSDSVIPCGSRGDAERLRKYVADYRTHPNQMMFNGRIVVSTFAGESCRFGANDLNQGWLETLKSEDMPPVFPPTSPNSFATLRDHL